MPPATATTTEIGGIHDTRAGDEGSRLEDADAEIVTADLTAPVNGSSYFVAVSWQDLD